MLKNLIEKDIDFMCELSSELFKKCPSEYGLTEYSCTKKDKDMDCLMCWKDSLLKEKERRQLIDEKLVGIKQIFWNNLKVVASSDYSEGWDFATVANRGYTAFNKIKSLLCNNRNIDFVSCLNNVEKAYIENFRITDTETTNEKEKCEQYFDILCTMVEDTCDYLKFKA